MNFNFFKIVFTTGIFLLFLLSEVNGGPFRLNLVETRNEMEGIEEAFAG